MEKLLSKYFSGNCTLKEVEEVERFALSNEVEFEKSKKVWEMASAYSYPKNKLDFSEIQSRLEKKEGSKRVFLSYGFKKSTGWRVAATILLLAVLGFGLFTTYNSKDNFIQVVTIENSIEKVTLEDGTLISAKKGAVISVSDKYNEGSRIVKLEGEAFFDVARNVNSPFTIHAATMDVKVLGTSFYVKSNRVEVKSGKVHVSNANGGVDLIKGEFAVLNNGLIEKGTLETLNNNWAWVDKVLVFENTGLSSVIADIEATYAVKVSYDAAFKDLKFTGKFDGQKLNEVIKVIEESLGIKLTLKKIN